MINNSFAVPNFSSITTKQSLPMKKLNSLTTLTPLKMETVSFKGDPYQQVGKILAYRNNIEKEFFWQSYDFFKERAEKLAPESKLFAAQVLDSEGEWIEASQKRFAAEKAGDTDKLPELQAKEMSLLRAKYAKFYEVLAKEDELVKQGKIPEGMTLREYSKPISYVFTPIVSFNIPGRFEIEMNPKFKRGDFDVMKEFKMPGIVQSSILAAKMADRYAIQQDESISQLTKFPPLTFVFPDENKLEKLNFVQDVLKPGDLNDVFKQLSTKIEDLGATEIPPVR